MEPPAQVEAIAGCALESDHYFNGTGYWSNNAAVSREFTLIEIEAIEALAREKNVEIAPLLLRYIHLLLELRFFLPQCRQDILSLPKSPFSLKSLHLPYRDQ